MTFEKYFEKLETANDEQLSTLVVDFMNEWNENRFVNEFEHKLTKIEFLNTACKKFIDNGTYPEGIHKLLVDELSGKQAKMLINSLPLSTEIVSDYEAKFLATKQVYEKIDFIEARGINFDAMQNSILKNSDLKTLKYYANTVEKANIKIIIGRLVSARTRYSVKNLKIMEENRNLCAYLKALDAKRSFNRQAYVEK